MRAIDADALREQFQEQDDWRDPERALVHITGIWAEIDNAPTIEHEQSDYKTDHGYMWICPDCGLVVHSDYKKCVRCGHEKEDKK